MYKYLIIVFMAFLMSLSGTCYIMSVQSGSILGVFVFEYAGPLLGMLYAHFFIDAKSLRERFLLANCAAIGYAIGGITPLLLNNLL